MERKKVSRVRQDKEFKNLAIERVEEAFVDVQGTAKVFADRIFTVMDMFAVPQKLSAVDGEDLSLGEWLGRELEQLNNLQTPEDFQYFSRQMQLALASIEEGRGQFLTPKKVDQRPLHANARRVKQMINKGFTCETDIQRFFDVVQLDLKKNVNDFFVNRVVGGGGHERASACRLLKRGLAMSTLETLMQSVGPWAQYFFGIGECPDPRANRDGKSEMGLFHSADLGWKSAIFGDEQQRREGAEDEIFRWRQVNDLVVAPTLVLRDFRIDGIKFIEVGFKDANEALRKLERKGQFTREDIDELFRFRVVFERLPGETDDMLRHRKLSFLAQVDHAAASRKNIPVEVETRTINGLSRVSNDPDENQAHQKAQVSPYEFSNFKHKRAEGTMSGAGYQNFSQKIKLRDPDTGKMLFACEMQLVDTEEYKMNENPKTTAAKFPRKLETVGGMELPRMESVMTRRQYVAQLEAWLRNYQHRHPVKKNPVWDVLEVEWAKDEQPLVFPQKMEGVHTYHDGWQSEPEAGKWRESLTEDGKKRFTFAFGPGDGNISDKKFAELAETAFQFLWATGKIRKVPRDFPRTLRAPKKDLEASSLFLGSDAYEQIAEKIPASGA